ncbi:MAG: DASS family sodium-coupled anion symporter [FCB group bacterium]|nr:DASS family sodium-coupled anion symporter [FCB group bacterium]
MRAFLYWVQEKRWLLIILLMGILLYWLPYPDSISVKGYRTFVISIMAISLIILEPIPLPATALLIAVLEVSFRIASPSEVARSYMSDSVFFIMGSLMMAVAIIHQGLDTRLAMGIIRITGNKVRNIVLGFTVISALLSSFIGEHTVAAMLLPVGLTLVKYASDKKPAPQLTAIILFSIAYGAIIGSIGTPSGGARNAIMIEYWKSATDSGQYLTYYQWMLMAYPLVIIQTVPAALLLGLVFKPEYKILDTPIRKLRVQVAKKGRLTAREFVAIGIFILTLLSWVFFNERIGMGIIAISGAILYMATGLVEWKDISNGTNWGVILLFAGAISLGVQMKNAGTALWISQSIISLFGGLMSEIKFLPYLINIGMTTILGNIMSSSGTVAVLGPITLSMNANPLYMGMTTAIVSSFGYFSAFAAPACMIIYSSGLVKVTDFLRAGWRVGLMSILTTILVIIFYWPLIIHLTNFK